MDAAQALFLEKGYAATTLGDVVARSGGSLATLYELFGSKPGLLVAMVTERCAAITDLIACASVADIDLHEGLRLIAHRLYEQLGHPSVIALQRVIAAEAPHLPEIGRLFYEAGPATARRTMAQYLAAQTARGALAIDDTEVAATIFFSMLICDRQTRLLCGMTAICADADVDRHIDNVVAAFARLYAA